MKPDLEAIRARASGTVVSSLRQSRRDVPPNEDALALLAYIAELEAQISAQPVGRWAPGETEWANRIANAEQRFVEEYDARKAAERQVEELKARIVTLEAMR